MSYNANHAAPGCGSDDATPCTCGTCARCLSRAGDGRAGATAPTDRFQRAEVVREALTAAGYEGAHQITYREAAAVFDAVLAAWKAGLTLNQLYDFQLEIEGQTGEAELRAALTRLGGAHE